MKKITIDDVINIDYEAVEEHIIEFILEKTRKNNIERVVLGLSGGVDSSTVLALLVKALGKDSVTVLIMPDPRITREEDVEDALSLARKYGVKYYLIDISKIFDSYSTLPFFDYKELIVNGNLRARIRANILYYYANKNKALVVGTSDRSEILIGYYTKYGDGASDIIPIGALYKTQVRKLAEKLGLPEHIVNKPSSPGFWKEHLAEKELGIKYEVIDTVLYALFDLGVEPEKVPDITSTPPETVEKILEMHRNTRHKRKLLEAPSFPWVKDLFKEL